MATITITTEPTHDARIAAAFGSHLGLSGSASAAQIKAELVQYARDIVRAQEQRAATFAAVSGVSAVTIT